MATPDFLWSRWALCPSTVWEGMTAVDCFPDKVQTLPPPGLRAIHTSVCWALGCSKLGDSFVHLVSVRLSFTRCKMTQGKGKTFQLHLRRGYHESSLSLSTTARHCWPNGCQPW